MDVATQEFLRQVGVFIGMMLIVLFAFRKSQDNLGDIIKANSAAQKASAEALQAVLSFLTNYTGHMAKLQNAFEDHTKAETDASNDNIKALENHTTALKAVTSTLTSVQTSLGTQLTNAMGEMRGAQDRIVAGVSAHLDSAVEALSGLAGQTAGGVKSSVVETADKQTKALVQKMQDDTERLEKDLNQNGEATRGKIEEVHQQLKGLTETLSALQQDVHTLNEQALDAATFKTDLAALEAKVDRLIAAFEQFKTTLTPPAAPALPSSRVDPLAPAPQPTKEEKKA